MDFDRREIYREVMRMILAVALLVGCSGESEPVNPDALEIDAVPADASPDFFGEPCALPMIPEYPGAVATCHEDRGFCVDLNGDGAGECRAWCDTTGEVNAKYECKGPRHGGTPTWTSDGSTTDKPFVCVCVPP